MAKCKNGCGTELKWKTPYVKGDRPIELNNKPHNCPNYSGGKKDYSNRWTPQLKSMRCIFCDMCGKWFVNQDVYSINDVVNYTTIKEHCTQYHPNGEILDNIDDMVTSDQSKEQTRIDWNQPKRTKKYTLVGKIVY